MPTHADRAIHLKSPLADDVLLPRQVTGNERFSEPFRYDLQLLSEQGNVNPDEILGKTVCVSYELPSGGAKRHFHGFVTEFGQVGYRNRLHEYQAIVRPWFWLLTRTADCRIFQQRSVPEIFQEVCKAWGFTDYKLKLNGSYPKRDYCVQYRETDFNFLSRLLEEEGIYYFFEHTDASHVMVLADDSSAHETQAGYESVPFYPPGTPEARRERDHLSQWSFTKTVQPGAYATTDFDFKQPRASLLSTETIGRKHPHSSYEIFDYPAELAVMQNSESKRIAKLRIQELQSPHMVLRGQGSAAGLATGRRFKLTQYPREDLNIEYLITGVGVSFSSDPFDTGVADTDEEFSCSIEAVDLRTPFRPTRETHKPIVHGSQTAMVVGPKGEEIYTDEHARVKVQFHWDRHGKVDENSSCWIRVAQVWAGKGWGSLHIPRIGHEVIVSFLEGDPDQPIITGRVYNGEAKSPYDLPANKTQSGIKSRSSKEGAAANFNEIRFEDKKGSEQVYIHAEKNQDIMVENDETHTVGHDRTKDIGNDETTHVKHNRTETVDNDETITIGGNRTEKVTKDETITISGARTESVTKDEKITISGARTESVSKDETITISGARTENVAKDESVSIGKNQTLSVSGNRTATVSKDEGVTITGAQTLSVGKDQRATISKNQNLTVGDARTTSIGKDDSLQVGKTLTIIAADSITLRTGSASLTMKKDGTIAINGKNIGLDGSGKITATASSNIVMKGSKITQN
jgi:type VI secretion system secreted protein VgrG